MREKSLHIRDKELDKEVHGVGPWAITPVCVYKREKRVCIGVREKSPYVEKMELDIAR